MDGVFSSSYAYGRGLMVYNTHQVRGWYFFFIFGIIISVFFSCENVQSEWVLSGLSRHTDDDSTKGISMRCLWIRYLWHYTETSMASQGLSSTPHIIKKVIPPLHPCPRTIFVTLYWTSDWASERTINFTFHSHWSIFTRAREKKIREFSSSWSIVVYALKKIFSLLQKQLQVLCYLFLCRIRFVWKPSLHVFFPEVSLLLTRLCGH